MRHLYIIGNGFDLHHHIPSSYQNYYQWLKDKHIGVLHLINDYYDSPTSEWWSDFEVNLGEKDIREYAENVARENYPDFSSDEFRDRDYHASEFIAGDESLAVCFHITQTFSEWIESLPEADNNCRVWIEKEDSFFINFNYTLTLENIYHINPNNILHIHGSLLDREYVLGHGKSHEELRKSTELNIPDPPKGWEEEYTISEWYEQYTDMFIEQAIDATIHRLAEMEKNVAGIIDENKMVFESMKNVEVVHIYGFSCSPIDSLYLDKISSSINLDNVFWEISYYKEEDKENVQSFIESHHIKVDNYRLIKLNDILLSNHNQFKLEFN